MNNNKSAQPTPVLKLTYAALCLALAVVLPFLTGQIKTIGNMLSPMHFPVIICGFLCGGPWGAVIGFTAPILRSVLFGMPVLYPNALGMAFELATYGFVSGLCYKLFPKKIPFIYLSLIVAMISGRLVWGVARVIMAGLSGTEFPLSAFLAGAVTSAIPGIILQIVLIPPIVMLLQKIQPKRTERVSNNNTEKKESKDK